MQKLQYHYKDKSIQKKLGKKKNFKQYRLFS